MNEIPPSPARTTNTMYSYVERLAAEQAPRSAAMLLGLRWSFGLPRSGLDTLEECDLREYSLPLNPTPIRDVLAERGGIAIVRHGGETPESLDEHLAAGKPALVPSDVFYFHFRPAYQRLHHARLVLVRRGETSAQVHVEDGWWPAAEGVVDRADLEQARYSTVPQDIALEPLFAGAPLSGEWFEVEVNPPAVETPKDWVRSLVETLSDEMARPRDDERGVYGIGAFRRFQQWLEEKLGEDAGKRRSLAARRAGSLLLRPELSSRLYFGAFLRTAAHWLRAPQLSAEATAYRQSLGHFQAAMDVLTKTVRTHRPEYDDFVRHHLGRAIEAEERLLGVLSSLAERRRGGARETSGRLVAVGHGNSFQDPSIAVVEGGKVYAEAVERHTQCKRAVAVYGLHYSWRDVKKALESLEILPVQDATIAMLDTWDAVTFYNMIDRPEVSQLIGEKGFGRFSAGTLQLAATQLEPAYRTQIAWLLRDLRCRITAYSPGQDFVDAAAEKNLTWEAETVDHHLAHAATAVYTSPFDECTVLIVDGYGEGHGTSIYRFRDNEFELLFRSSILLSLGLLYFRITYLCGFDPSEGEEWKVMGMAAYGSLREEIYDFFRTRAGDYGGRSATGRPLSEADFQELNRIVGGFRHHSDPDILRSADLAYNFQRFFTEAVLELARYAHELSPSKNLAYAGGCALNSSANGKILAHTEFEHLHIPCAPGDDGNSLGAALYRVYCVEGKAREKKVMSAYLGRNVDQANVERMLAFADLNYRKFDDEASLCTEVAQLLAAGKTVGWMQNRAEFGPRALGNRSILADPRPEDMKDRINSKVKSREWYRPLAPAILHEFGEEYFEDYQESPYMERTLRFREEVRDRIPAVVHRNGTGRLQTVREEWNPIYYRLIRAFYDETGIPLLLNTSLNVMGKPIVHSEEDAITVLYTTGLDFLVIGSYLLSKQPG